MKAYVKYCGGCNPRFDREALVRKICSERPEISITADAADKADVSLIICGCASACADISDALSPYGCFILWQEDPGGLYRFLDETQKIPETDR